MAKLSVYVPDELWDRARVGAEDKNPSQLIQEALSRMVADRQPEFSAGAAIHRERLMKIKVEKRAEAQKLYDAGYTEGIELAEKWPWTLLDRAAELDFDLELLEDEDEEYGDLAPWSDELEMDVGDELANVRPLLKSKVYELGMRRALRDVCEAVLSGEQTVDERSETPQPSEDAN